MSVAHDRVAMLLDLGRPAMAFAELARRSTPEDLLDANMWCLLARAELDLGNPSGALEATTAAIEIEPGWDWAHRLHSSALMRSGDDGAAVTAARTAIACAPFEPMTHIRHSECLLAVDQPVEAMVAAREAIRLRPELAQAHLLLGRSLLALDEEDAAGEAFLAVLDRDPANAMARNELATLALRRRRWVEAATGFVAASASDPTGSVADGNARRVIRTALHRTTVGVAVPIALSAGLAAQLLGRDLGGGDSLTRDRISVLYLAALAMAAAIAVFGLRWQQLPPSVQQLSREVVSTDRRARVGLGLLALAGLGLAAASSLPPAVALVLVLLSAALSLTAALVVSLRLREPEPPCYWQGPWRLTGGH